MVTAYDAPTARLAAAAASTCSWSAIRSAWRCSVTDSTVPVTMEDMLHHAKPRAAAHPAHSSLPTCRFFHFATVDLGLAKRRALPEGCGRGRDQSWKAARKSPRSSRRWRAQAFR